ncbi:conserved hypothetical protein [Ralstonia solanacearum K60]|nr:conserved hypothetical protein [Ralstonia solanacearum K60]
MHTANSFGSASFHIVWTHFGKYNRLRHPSTMTSERGTGDGHDIHAACLRRHGERGRRQDAAPRGCYCAGFSLRDDLSCCSKARAK